MRAGKAMRNELVAAGATRVSATAMPRVAAGATPGVFVTAKALIAVAATPNAPAGPSQVEHRRKTVGDRRPSPPLTTLGGQALHHDRAELVSAPAAKAAGVGEQAEPQDGGEPAIQHRAHPVNFASRRSATSSSRRAASAAKTSLPKAVIR